MERLLLPGSSPTEVLRMNGESEKSSGSSRREFLSGAAVRKQISQTGEQLADELVERNTAPESGDTVRLATRAMACEFSVILNPTKDRRQVIAASDTLDIVHKIESDLTVYRETSRLLELNRQARVAETEIPDELFAILKDSLDIAKQTDGAFTPTALVLNQLWRRCKAAGVPPEASAVVDAVAKSDFRAVQFDAEKRRLRFDIPEIGFDLSGIGKGYALNRAAVHLETEGVEDFLFHGGHSSILVRGSNAKSDGWPVGIRHPLFPHKRLATLLLNDCGFSSSGSGVQFFRHQGKKYGHLFDPRTGWPVEHLLSVAVIAPTAAIADALSTAFYVMKIEETQRYCEQHPEIKALLIPQPKRGAQLEIIRIGIDEHEVFREEETER